MERDGSNVRLLFDSVGADTFPSWSPDGSHVVFTSTMSGSADIYRMKSDGTDLRRLTDGSSRIHD